MTATVETNCPICDRPLSEMISRADAYRYMQCPLCRLVTADPKPSDQELFDYYQGYLFDRPEESEAQAQTSQIEADTQRITQDLIGVAGVQRGATLLDYGGGTGFYSHGFARQGFDVTMIDIDAAACDYARDRFGEEFRVVRADPSDWQPDRAYDLVFANHVIEHYRDLPRFFEGIRRSLRPGGVAVVTTPNQACLEYFFRPRWLAYYLYQVSGRNIAKLVPALARFLYSPWLCCDPPRHLYGFNAESMRRLIEREHMQPLRITTFWSISTYYSMKQYSEFRLRRLGDVLKMTEHALAQVGIRTLALLTRRSDVGNDLVAIARMPA